MTAKGMTKAGPITLAVGLIAGGGVLLLYNLGTVKNLDWVWKLWPLLLVGVGLEYFIKRALIREEEVHFHLPSILLILVLILSSGVLYAVTGVGRSLLDGIPFHQFKPAYTRTWEADPVAVKAGERLVIKNARVGVEITPAPDNMLRVKAVVRGPDTGPAGAQAGGANPEVKREGEVVSVTVPETGGWFNDTVVTDLEVAVPDGLDVRVENTAGRVEARNAGINLTVAGNTGSIETEDVGGNLEVRNNTGRIEIRNPGGDVMAGTNTGSIELTSDRPLAGKYALESNTGRVGLRLPGDSDLTIEAESRTGRITVHDLPDDRGSRDAGENIEKAAGVDVKKDKFSYTLGSGKGRADLRSGTGAVNITVR